MVEFALGVVLGVALAEMEVVKRDDVDVDVGVSTGDVDPATVLVSTGGITGDVDDDAPLDAGTEATLLVPGGGTAVDGSLRAPVPHGMAALVVG